MRLARYPEPAGQSLCAMARQSLELVLQAQNRSHGVRAAPAPGGDRAYRLTAPVARVAPDAPTKEDADAHHGLRHRIAEERMPGAGTDHTREWSALGGPIVVLVEPQLGENIGTAARAMANFGLTRLRLVRPRDAWP